MSEEDSLGDDEGSPPVEELPVGFGGVLSEGVDVSDGLPAEEVVVGPVLVEVPVAVVPPPLVWAVEVSLRPDVVPGRPPGCPTGWPPFCGGVSTLVVGTPFAPVDTTVVGADDDDVCAACPGVGEPVSVIGLPGTAFPGTTCELSETPPWRFVLGVAVSVAVPGPASSATAAKAVATTRPATPSTA